MKLISNDDLDIDRFNTQRLNLFHLLHPINYKSLKYTEKYAIKLAFPTLIDIKDLGNL